MDNKITRSRLSVMFKYDWFKFVVVLVVSIVVSIFIFNWIGNTRKWERIDILVVADKFYDEKLAEDALAYLKEQNPDTKIREINISWIKPSDTGYQETYEAQAGTTASICIIPESEALQTGYKFSTLVKNDYEDSAQNLYESMTDWSKFAMPNEEIQQYYFSNGWQDRTYRYVYDGEDPELDTYLANTANRCVYGLRIDDIASDVFKFYKYDGNAVEMDENNVPKTEKGYLFLNSTTNIVTVGSLGNDPKYYYSDETFEVAQFMLKRYFYKQTSVQG